MNQSLPQFNAETGQGDTHGRLFKTIGFRQGDYNMDPSNPGKDISQAIREISEQGGGTLAILEETLSLSLGDTGRIYPKSNVHLTGHSTRTRITTVADFTGAMVEASGALYTPAAPLINFKMTHIELDGSNMQASPYAIGNKGVDGHNFYRCVFQHLYIHDTPASGLGIDNLDQCMIQFNHIQNCGTPGQSQGSNGIGIGTGGNNQESVLITNNITEGNANAGILLEDLESVVGAEKFYIIANNISINDFDGVRISGCDNAVVEGNCVYNPTNSGIRAIDFVTHYVNNLLIKNNIIDGADSYGIYTDTNATDVLIEGNIVKNGTLEGILSRASRCRISGNIVYENGRSGIFVGAGPSGPSIVSVIITDNLVYNNANVTASTDGIRLDGANAALVGITITGNRCFDNQGSPTQRYGIILSGGTGHSAINVSNNDLRGNLTGAFLKSSFTLSTTLPGLSLLNNHGLNPDCSFAVAFSTTPAFTRSNGRVQTLTLTDNITPTLPVTANTLQAGERMTLILTQDGTGGRTVTWPSNFKKAGGTLALSAGAGAVDVIEMIYDGTNWQETGRNMANA